MALADAFRHSLHFLSSNLSGEHLLAYPSYIRRYSDKSYRPVVGGRLIRTTQVSSASPITALVSPKTTATSIVTVNLDGRQDWVIAQRQGLLAWTGLSLSVKPQYYVKLGLAHWGNTYTTGRGLLALAGTGQIYQVQLKAGESYVAHPRLVIENVPRCCRF